MSIVAGWYADPAGPGMLRWWDGTSWTLTTAPMPSVPPQHSPYGAVPPGVTPDDGPWNTMDLLVPRARTLGTRALVWGIVAILLPIAFAPAVMALVFGAMGLDRSRRLQASGLPASGRSGSIAGLVLGGASLGGIIGLIVVASTLSG
jgi:hypothetical protein